MSHPYQKLSPDLILQAVESLGVFTDGRLFPLNSYENRVYQVGLEDKEPVIAKFYRPERWSKEQIIEEHQLTQLLQGKELPVVAPLVFNQQSLHSFQGFHFALFPRRGGHPPELDNFDTLYELGKVLGQFHGLTQNMTFQYRPQITLQSYGADSAKIISEFIPSDLKEAYNSIAKELIKLMEQKLSNAPALHQFPIHGDFHPGNILWRDDKPNLVDFDDTRTGPAIQDLWMLLSGDRQQQTLQMEEILAGYEHFHTFNLQELSLIETYRTLRMMQYAAWLALRWQDPAFPLSFPWFNTPHYWAQHIGELREQQWALQEPTLKLTP